MWNPRARFPEPKRATLKGGIIMEINEIFKLIFIRCGEFLLVLTNKELTEAIKQRKEERPTTILMRKEWIRSAIPDEVLKEVFLYVPYKEEDLYFTVKEFDLYVRRGELFKEIMESFNAKFENAGLL
jgi:hypothetical protein